jgi:two-component system, NarL family, sensor kinase
MRSSTSPARFTTPLIAAGLGASVVVLVGEVNQRDWAQTVGTAVLTLLLAVALRGSIAGTRRFEQLRRAEELRGRVDAALFDHMMSVLDEEREAIAHRLHDGPQQVAAAIRLMTDATRTALDDGDEARARETLARLEEHAMAVSEDLRRTTARLHPVVLQQLGLLPALESLAETVREEYEAETTLSLPRGRWSGDPERDVALYQLAREAAVSAARSGAREIHIRLAVENGEVTLAVAPDAVSGEPDPRLDLREQLLAARAARMGGSLRMEDGNGRITVRAPA